MVNLMWNQKSSKWKVNETQNWNPIRGGLVQVGERYPAQLQRASHVKSTELMENSPSCVWNARQRDTVNYNLLYLYSSFAWFTVLKTHTCPLYNRSVQPLAGCLSSCVFEASLLMSLFFSDRSAFRKPAVSELCYITANANTTFPVLLHTFKSF